MGKPKTKIKTTGEHLREIMAEQRLSTERVAEMLGASTHAVTAWLRPPDNVSYRVMPAPKLRLLQLLLQQSTPTTKQRKKQ